MSFRSLLLLPLVIAIPAQVAPKVQSPVWATRPDATAFEKIENNPWPGPNAPVRRCLHLSLIITRPVSRSLRIS